MADLATARREAEVWLAEHGGALWCADVELVLRSLLAASPEPAPALPEEAEPCCAECPRTKPCDEVYRDVTVPDHCERCHHPVRCHVPAARGGRS